MIVVAPEPEQTIDPAMRFAYLRGRRDGGSGSGQAGRLGYHVLMAQLTRLQAAAFLARWRLVHEQEVAALRVSPIAHKFRQICALVASRDAFPADPDRSVQAAGVAARWRRIRAHYDG